MSYLSEYLIEFTSYFLFLYIVMLLFIMYRKEKRKYVEEERKKYTFDFCVNVQEKIKTYHKMENNWQFYENGPELFFIYNQIAIGVNSGVLDEKIVKDNFENMFIEEYKRNRYKMLQFRDKKGDPSLFEQFEILTRRWEEKAEKMKGEYYDNSLQKNKKFLQK